MQSGIEIWDIYLLHSWACCKTLFFSSECRKGAVGGQRLEGFAVEGGRVTQYYMSSTITICGFYILYCVPIRKNPEAKNKYFQVKINSYLC